MRKLMAFNAETSVTIMQVIRAGLNNNVVKFYLSRYYK